MLYNIYKNCTDQQFEKLQPIVKTLQDDIKNKFFAHLKSLEGPGDTDSLSINFSFIDPDFKSNLSVIFEDAPKKLSFRVIVLKAMDKGDIRYAKKELILSDKAIEYISGNLDKIISLAIEKYSSWSEEDVMNAEQVSLKYDGPF